jgi:hypothetical protein
MAKNLLGTERPFSESPEDIIVRQTFDPRPVEQVSTPPQPKRTVNPC